ncbi:MAG: helix-turn-helix domain-containing protein [Rhizobiaceae bacterium]|nr:helix-turn-helix domain-containing protein [Rhizobiaceae bacterium]
MSHLDNALLLAATLFDDNPQTRIASTLCRLAGPGMESDEETFIDCSQQELGEMAGLSRNSAGPVIRHLEQQGLIRREYKRFIFNPVRLRAYRAAPEKAK